MARPMHDEVIRRARALARATDSALVAGAFVASLGQRPGFWRAPLPALALASAVPLHRYRPFSAASRSCHECGLEPTVDEAELDPRGAFLPDELATAVLVLERAKGAAAPRPTSADLKRLSELLAVVGALPPTAREAALNEALRKAKLVNGNRYDVRSVIEALGACGVLETPEYPGFTTRWTSFAARQDRPSMRVECDPPIAFWTAAHGVNAANVERWFGHLGVRAPDAALPRSAGVAQQAERVARSRRTAARSTQLEVGDVIAFAIDGSWFAAMVVRHAVDKGGRSPVLKRLEWAGDAAPTLHELEGAKPCGPPVQIGLWERDDARGRWATVGNRPGPALPFEPTVVAGLRRDGSGLRALTTR